MSKNYKIMAIAISAIAFGLISFAGTYAFLTAGATKTNTIGIATNEITLEEEFTAPDTLTPGLSITKKPHVKNTGNSAVYVRAKVLFSDSDAKAFCDDLVIDSKWVYNDTTGYYYYTDKLDANASTNDIFTTVKIKDDANVNDLKAFDILILTESCSGQADTYQAAWGI